MPALCIALIFLSLLIALPASWLARWLGRRMNAFDGAGVRGQVKAAPRRVPNTGGIGIFVAIALPMLAGLGAAWDLNAQGVEKLSGDVWLVSSRLAPSIVGIQQQTPGALVLLGSLLALHIMGLIDDRRPLGPGIKLPVMLMAAAVVIIGTDTRLLTLLDSHGPGGIGRWGSVAITIFWIVVVTNAFNFLDNMDGLSGGVAAIAAAFFMITALVGGQWFVAALLALLLGALLGFLHFNFPRTKAGATLFMGDSGSLVVGFLLAFVAVRITYLPAAVPGAAPSTAHAFLVLTPLIILAIPLYDFCSVCLLRIRQGRSPFVGDLQHFSHRLVKHGLSRRSAVLVIYGCTAVTGIGAIALPKLEPWQAALVGVQTLLVLLVIALYEWSRSPREGTGEATGEVGPTGKGDAS